MNLYERTILKQKAQPVLDYLFGSKPINGVFQQPTEVQWKSYLIFLESYFIDTSFLELEKDVLDTVKPYKNFYAFGRDVFADLTYFLQGWYNMLRGIGMLIVSPIVAYQANVYANRNIIDAVGIALALAASPFITGFLQVAFSPFIATRALWRSIITFASGSPRLEDSKTIQKIVSDHDSGALKNNPPAYNNAFNTLYAKTKKNLRRHTQVAGNESELNSIMYEIKVSGASSSTQFKTSEKLFRFFSQSIATRTAAAKKTPTSSYITVPSVV